MSLLAGDRAEIPIEALAVEAYELDGFALDAIAVEALVVEVAVLDGAVLDGATVAGTTVAGAPVAGATVAGTTAEPAVENEKPQRHLRVAPDSVRRRRHVRIAAAAAAVSISATLFAVVGFNVELAQHQIQLQKLQRSLQAQQTRYYELRTEVAQRSSPPQIVAKAEGLGLVQAQTTYVPAPIMPPPADPTGTSKVQPNAPGSSLEPVE
jgi:cell division protein FtsL